MTPIELATELAHQAGAVLLSRLGEPHEIREKSRRADLVTEADHASEAIILERLRKEYPDATILAEESGMHEGSSRERWIVDPLDGTTNFAHGYPLFCVSIGYERDGELVAGVIYAPALDECFAAERGAGARMNGAPIHVSGIETLGEAMTCTGFHPADFERNAACFREISHRAQAVRRDGSAALDLGFLACGRFDGFWEFDLSPWDVAAGTLIVREAGGRVSRLDGGPATLDGRQIVATNGHIHDELCEALASS